MEGVTLFLDNFADWDSLVRVWPLLWQGLQLTVLLSVVTLPIAILVGLTIAVLYSFHHKVANVLLLIWIDLFRSFPVLVLLILIFYGLPFLGLKLPSFAACVLAIVLNNSGYYGAMAQEQTYNPTPLTAAAVIFFVALWPFARWVAKLERDMLLRQR